MMFRLKSAGHNTQCVIYIVCQKIIYQRLASNVFHYKVDESFTFRHRVEKNKMFIVHIIMKLWKHYGTEYLLKLTTKITYVPVVNLLIPSEKSWIQLYFSRYTENSTNNNDDHNTIKLSDVCAQVLYNIARLRPGTSCIIHLYNGHRVSILNALFPFILKESRWRYFQAADNRTTDCRITFSCGNYYYFIQ